MTETFAVEPGIVRALAVAREILKAIEWPRRDEPPHALLVVADDDAPVGAPREVDAEDLGVRIIGDRWEGYYTRAEKLIAIAPLGPELEAELLRVAQPGVVGLVLLDRLGHVYVTALGRDQVFAEVRAVESRMVH